MTGRVIVLGVAAALVLTACGNGSLSAGDDFGRALEARQATLEADVAPPDVEPCEPAAPTSGLSVDERLPQVVLPCLAGGPAVDMAALSGQPTLVNLWASWCEPCRREMPLLQRAHTAGNGVQLLGVDTKDPPTAAAGFLSAVGATYPQVVDPEGELLAALGLPGLPVTVALDADGRVVARQVGELGEDDLARLVGAATESP